MMIDSHASRDEWLGIHIVELTRSRMLNLRKRFQMSRSRASMRSQSGSAGDEYFKTYV